MRCKYCNSSCAHNWVSKGVSWYRCKECGMKYRREENSDYLMCHNGKYMSDLNKALDIFKQFKKRGEKCRHKQL